jgi:glycosyltransferase involved in cell wall biosynthesis
LRIQYHLAHHIFVHTEKMKDELIKDFGVPAEAVTVIPYGINNALQPAKLTAEEAKHRLGVSRFEKTILFFGNMRPSKGLDDLLAAFERLQAKDPRYRLIVAGRPVKGQNNGWQQTRQALRRLEEQGSVILRNEFIPDEDIALYFTAADVAALPYTEIFQSGVLFLAYSFGLPVVATDVGELGEDIVEGRTGFLCQPRDAGSLAGAVEKYFESDLFRELDSRRQEIRDYVATRHSWSKVSAITHAVYRELSGANAASGRQS